MNLAHKIALDPTSDQKAYFRQACGTSRFVWNLAHEEWERRFKAASEAAKTASTQAKTKGLKKAATKRFVQKAIEEVGGWPSSASIKADFNSWKYEALPWLEGVHRDAHAQPFSNLQKAYASYRKGLTKKPKFKKKGKSKDSFYVANDKLRLEDRTIYFPIVGRVRMREPIRFQGKIMSATVSRTADKWFVSIAVETQNPRPVKLKADKTPRRSASITPLKSRRPCAGLDLGLLHLAVTSAGVVYDAPKPLKSALRKLARLQRSRARRYGAWKASGVKDYSNGLREINLRIAKLHARIASIRLDFIHKLTTDLCRENQAVVIEDLNVKGMIQNPRLSRAISDVGWGEIRRQLEYKSLIYGTRLVVANRWLPSTKKCSRCGVVGPGFPLSQRTFRCGSCGFECDRDLNAALNLEQEYRRLDGNLRLRTGRIGRAFHDALQPSLVEAGTGTCPLVGNV